MSTLHLPRFGLPFPSCVPVSHGIGTIQGQRANQRIRQVRKPATLFKAVADGGPLSVGDLECTPFHPPFTLPSTSKREKLSNGINSRPGYS